MLLCSMIYTIVINRDYFCIGYVFSNFTNDEAYHFNLYLSSVSIDL